MRPRQPVTRLPVTASLTAVLVLFAVSPAVASTHDKPSWRDAPGRVELDDAADTATVLAEHADSSGGGGGSEGAGRSDGSGGPACRWLRASGYPSMDGKVAYYRHCQGEQPQLMWAGEGPQGVGVPVEVLRERAVDRLALPTPALHTSPRWDERGLLVHLPTWLWVDGSLWGPRSASASAGPVTVTATAAPQRVIWRMGNGDAVVCQGAGTPYDPAVHEPEKASPDCGYTYRHTSEGRRGEAYQVTVTVEWGVSWSVEGAEGGPLEALTTTRTIRVPVYEIQALNY